MGTKEPQFEGMSLSNVGDGALERQFQDALAEIAGDIFSRPDQWEAKKKAVTATVKLEVEVSLDVETMQKFYACTSSLSRPKRKKVLGAAFIRDGVVLVEPDRQTNLVTLTKKENS